MDGYLKRWHAPCSFWIQRCEKATFLLDVLGQTKKLTFRYISKACDCDAQEKNQTQTRANAEIVIFIKAEVVSQMGGAQNRHAEE